MSELLRDGNALTEQDKTDIRNGIGLGTAATLNVPSSGNATSGQVVKGDDTRLTDSREWTAATVDQTEAEDGTATTRRAWTAQRVRQAISAWWAASAGSLLKTINGNSLLGSGDLTIGGGGGATNLSYTASATGGTVSSDTGTDATLPLSDGTNAGLVAPAQHSKLAGIAAGATANSSDATLLNRANHTGTQASSTITMATARLLGRTTAGSGAAEEISVGSGLSLTAGTLSATGASSASSVSFTTTVPLDITLSVMPQQSVTGALAFSPSSTRNLMCAAYVRLVANGTNVPTYSGMVEHGSSAGWDNVSGRVNLLMFWWDGSNVWYSIQQPANASDLAAPVVSSAAIANATPTQIQITFSVALDTGSVPATSAFTISNSGGTDTVSAVAISGAVVTLTKSRTTLSTDTVTVGYTQPGTGRIRAASSGQDAATFSGQAVTNNVSSGGGTLAFVRANMATAASLVEAGDATVGYTYTASIDYPTWSGAAFVESTPLMVDGSRITAEKTGTNNGMISLTTATAPHRWDQAPQYAFGAFVLSGALNRIQGGSITAMSALADGALYSLRRSGTTVVLETSTDSGATWTTQHTWTGVSAGTTYRAVFNANGTGTTGPVVRPRGVGLSA